MNQKSILHQLTTNLSFRGDNSKSSSNSQPKVLLPKQSEQPEQMIQAVKKHQTISPESDKEITILNGITALPKTNNAKKRGHKLVKDLDKMNKERINHIRNLNRININGNDVPDPIESFEQLKTQKQWADETIPDKIVENFLSFGFSQPTPVQMQSMPVMLSNREIMVCAPTGSGKTIAYLFPIVAKLKMHEKNGARALILSPTRELARQVCMIL
jgi:ATP-dependent RNA helicase DDX52/ROK1